MAGVMLGPPPRETDKQANKRQLTGQMPRWATDAVNCPGDKERGHLSCDRANEVVTDRLALDDKLRTGRPG